MCFKPKTPPPPAAAPAPPLPPPDEQGIGVSRREENRKNYGANQPSYRVERPDSVSPINPDIPLRM